VTRGSHRREEHIARLAERGTKRTRRSAAELFISPRTVEWHLKKVFTKLGIRLAAGAGAMRWAVREARGTCNTGT